VSAPAAVFPGDAVRKADHAGGAAAGIPGRAGRPPVPPRRSDVGSSGRMDRVCRNVVEVNLQETLTFKLEDFEGPLDLLLYLVGKNKMNLYDVNIMELIDQYTAAIHTLQEDRMEVSS